MRRKTAVRLLALAAILGATVGVSVALAGSGVGSDAPSSTTGQQDDSWQAFADCLRTKGVDLPTFDDPVALKTWIGGHIESDQTLKTALEACAQSPGGHEKPGAEPGSKDRGSASGPGFEELRSCLQQHGVETPAGGPAAFKQWLGPQLMSDQAVRTAAQSCGLVLGDGGTQGSKG
jgi:hypothetical protein